MLSCDPFGTGSMGLFLWLWFLSMKDQSSGLPGAPIRSGTVTVVRNAARISISK